jgi:hypothetical protein
MSETNKTCGTCEHCLSAESSLCLKYCEIKSNHKRIRVRLGDAACEHYRQIKREESREEKLKRIEQRLEQLDADYFAKKIDIEQYRRQQAFLVNKRNGLEADRSKDKCDYSMIINY